MAAFLIPPNPEDPVRQPPGYPSAWKSEAVLIMRPTAVLPDACFRCGHATQAERLRVRLTWHARWLYLLLIQPVVYLLARLAAGKARKVLLPVCARHRRRRRWARAAAWTLIPLGCAAAIYGLGGDSLEWALGGLHLTLAAAVVASLEARLARVTSIDDHFIRLRGADAALLDQLPDWDAYQEGPR